MKKNQSQNGIDALIDSFKTEQIAKALVEIQDKASQLVMTYGEYTRVATIERNKRRYKAHEDARDTFNDFIKNANDDTIKLYEYTVQKNNKTKHISIIGYTNIRQSPAVRIWIQNIGENSLPTEDNGIEVYIPSDVNNGSINYIETEYDDEIKAFRIVPWTVKTPDDIFEGFNDNIIPALQLLIADELQQKEAEVTAMQTEQTRRLLINSISIVN